MRLAKVIQRRDVIREARQTWLNQYRDYSDEQALGWVGRTAGDVRQALRALDLETCSQADIDNAIGTSGWAANSCDECGGDFPVLLRLGQEPDYDNRWWVLCAGCLAKASAHLVATKPKE